MSTAKPPAETLKAECCRAGPAAQRSPPSRPCATVDSSEPPTKQQSMDTGSEQQTFNMSHSAPGRLAASHLAADGLHESRRRRQASAVSVSNG